MIENITRIKTLAITLGLIFLSGTVWAQFPSKGLAGPAGPAGPAGMAGPAGLVRGKIKEYSNGKILISTDTGETSVYLGDQTKIMLEESIRLDDLETGNKIVVIGSGYEEPARLIRLLAPSANTGLRNSGSPQFRQRRPGSGTSTRRPRQFGKKLDTSGSRSRPVSRNFLMGKVISVSPLEIEMSSGQTRKIKVDEQTKVFGAIEAGRETLVPGQNIVVVSAPNSGSVLRVTIRNSEGVFVGKSKPYVAGAADNNFVSSSEQPTFGINLRFGKGGNARSNMRNVLRMYSDSGVQAQTLSAYYHASVKMMQVVDSPGANQKYNWDRRLDRAISRNASSNVKTSIILSPHNARAKMPKNLEYWKAFVTQVVKRYSDKKYGPVLYYSLVNEPAAQAYWNDTAENYALLLKATYEALKEANPSAFMVLGSIPVEVVVNQPSRRDFFLDVLRYKYRDNSRADDYFDVVDVHIYDKPATFRKYIDLVKGWLNKPKPMIMTETAGTSNPEYGGNPAKQASDLIKRFVTAFGLGIKTVYWQPFNDHKAMNVGGTNRFNQNGLLDIELRPKLSYYTFQLMVNKLKGFNAVQRLGDGMYKFGFINRKPVYVLWSERAGEKANLEIDSAKVLVTHILEKEGITAPQTETVAVEALTLSSSPIFVETAR